MDVVAVQTFFSAEILAFFETLLQIRRPFRVGRDLYETTSAAPGEAGVETCNVSVRLLCRDMVHQLCVCMLLWREWCRDTTLLSPPVQHKTASSRKGCVINGQTTKASNK